MLRAYRKPTTSARTDFEQGVAEEAEKTSNRPNKKLCFLCELLSINSASRIQPQPRAVNATSFAARVRPRGSLCRADGNLRRAKGVSFAREVGTPDNRAKFNSCGS
jgi:hypothetical protein